MNFWMANPTAGIFPNCGNRDMATAVWNQDGKFAAVLLAASPAATQALPTTSADKMSGELTSEMAYRGATVLVSHR